tara:strand:+ start:1799 stop:3613 length:1815 start_codon:yes stop_codon:yes gene_type:complete
MKNEIIVIAANNKNLIKSIKILEQVLNRSKSKTLNIINLTSANIIDKILNKIPNLNNITVWNINKEIRQSLDSTGSKLIDPLIKIISCNKNYYYSSFFEMNLVNNNIWNSFVYAQIINNISRKTKSSKMHLFIDDYFLCKSVLEVSKIKSNSYLASKLSFYLFELKYFLKCILKWVYNLANEVFTYFVLKTFSEIKKNISVNKVTFSMLRLSWPNSSNKKNAAKYTYTGEHFNNLKKNEFYILSLLRQNSSRLYSSFSALRELKSLKNKKKILYIERYGFYKDLLKSYFSRNTLHDHKIKTLFKNNHLDFAYNFFILDLAWVDYPKNKYLESCTENFLKSNKKIKKILIPLFEHTEGKMILSKFNNSNINTIGLQQGAIGQSHKWRFIYATKVFKEFNNLFCPTKIFVIGKLEKELFSKLDIENTKNIGSLRSHRLKSKLRNNKKINILILLDMHNWKSMISSINLHLRTIPNSNILIRPHPSILNIEDVNKYNIEIDKNPHISRTLKLYTPNIIIAGDTGMVLDFCAGGFNILLIETNNYFSLSPLLLEKNKHVVYNIDNHRDRKKLISSISNAKKIKNTYDYAKNRIYLYSEDALKNLIRSF